MCIRNRYQQSTAFSSRIVAARLSLCHRICIPYLSCERSLHTLSLLIYLFCGTINKYDGFLFIVGLFFLWLLLLLLLLDLMTTPPYITAPSPRWTRYMHILLLCRFFFRSCLVIIKRITWFCLADVLVCARPIPSVRRFFCASIQLLFRERGRIRPYTG